jgi:hypothetical protein
MLLISTLGYLISVIEFIRFSFYYQIVNRPFAVVALALM